MYIREQRALIKRRHCTITVVADAVRRFLEAQSLFSVFWSYQRLLCNNLLRCDHSVDLVIASCDVY